METKETSTRLTPPQVEEDVGISRVSSPNNVSLDENTSAESDTSQQQRLSMKARAFSIDALLSVDDTQFESEDDEQESMRENLTSKQSADDPENLEQYNEERVTESSLETEDFIEDDSCVTSPALENTKCTLEMTDLWKKFHDLGTEMIITKSGRRMFPSLRVSFSDLDPKAHYQVFFDIAPVDNKRYRYAYHRSSWLVAGRADPPIPRRCYTHPDGPFRGDSLQKQSLSFEKVKLTNNIHDKWGYIILNSMHKYQPRIHLVRYDDKVPTVSSVSDLQKLDRKVFLFPETQFIGVTAYQNQLITKLKIDSNPFAKGFRDSARITQIDRESVDLLIKASRHGYTHPRALPPAMIGNMAFQSGLHSISGGIVAGRFPPSLPIQNLIAQSNLPKDLLWMYFDQLAATTQNNLQKAVQKANSMRFSPYNR